MFASLFARRSIRHKLSVRNDGKNIRLLVGVGLTLTVMLAMLTASSVAWSSPKVDRKAPQNPPPPRMPVAGDPDADEQVIRNSPEVITSTNWTNLYPELSVVSAVSSADAWAAGEYGQLLHYTGGSWVEVAPNNMRGEYITDIDMLSSSSGWLVSGYRAFQYNGSVWQDKSTGLFFDPLYVNYISAVSADNVWGIGYYYDSTTGSRNTIAHWDGTSWMAAGPVFTYTTYLSDIEMVSATAGWAVGYDYGGEQTVPVLLRYNAGTWSNATVPADVGSFFYISAASTTEIWFAGYDTNYVDKLFRYNGSTWSSFALPDGSYLTGLFMLNSTQGWATTVNSILRWNGTSWSVEYDITGTSINDISGAAGQVWAVGPADTILSRPGTGPWAQERGGPTTNTLYSVHTLSTDEAWAVGARGSIVHYTGGTWQRVTSPAFNPLYDVQMLSPINGYAVGSGAILEWDGTSWTRVVTSSTTLRGVYMLGSGDGWAVGYNGAIWNASGGVWGTVASPTIRDLYAVAMDSASHGWAVGYDYIDSDYVSILLEYTGGNWVDRSSSLPANAPSLRDILLAPGGATGWAAGSPLGSDARVMLRLNGGVWTVDTNVYNSVYSLSPEALGEVWAIGGSAYHYEGGVWQTENYPPTNALQYGISLIPGRGGWSVGSRGSIMKYDPLGPGQRYYDVPTTNTFYEYIECMAIQGVISGYDDNTFRPNNSITRGQLAKIVSNAAGFNADPGPQIFEDVPSTNIFYIWINRLSNLGIMGGYACGGEGEPCGSDNKPYFRTNNNATRGQISKIVSNAAGFSEPAGTQIFEDVPPGSVFYDWVQRLATRGIMGGYACGGAGEPCGPGNRPYFRVNNNATRGQVSKIVANTFFPGCATEVHPK